MIASVVGSTSSGRFTRDDELVELDLLDVHRAGGALDVALAPALPDRRERDERREVGRSRAGGAAELRDVGARIEDADDAERLLADADHLAERVVIVEELAARAWCRGPSFADWFSMSTSVNQRPRRERLVAARRGTTGIVASA